MKKKIIIPILLISLCFNVTMYSYASSIKDLEQQKNRDSCGRKRCDLCSQRDICMFFDRKRP